MSELSIISGNNDKILHDALEIRRKVFIEGQDVPEERELDGLDREARHYVGYIDKAPVAVARTRQVNENREVQGAYDVKIERVGVLPVYRGHGLGLQLMRSIVSELQDQPQVRDAVLESQTHALDFYKALGFTAFGDEFPDAGIMHRKMRKIVHPTSY